MITVRRSAERGHANHGWLDTYHSFSFADYFDAHNMGFRSLRVINEDRVQPGQGFGTHSHHDMEIITVVLSGVLEHKDSMGNQGIIRPGEIQRMSAGTGVRHSEFNPSATEPVHLYQIWILPEQKAIEPSYEQKTVSKDDRKGRLALLADKEPNSNAVKIDQDAMLYSAILERSQSLTHTIVAPRAAYVQVASGKVAVNGVVLEAGDGASIRQEPTLDLSGADDKTSEVLLFDLA